VPLLARAVLAALAAATLAQAARAAPIVRVEAGLPYGPGLRLDAYLPSGRAPVPGVVVVHGGGWSAGSRRSVDRYAERLAALGWDGFAIDYRLAPRARFPAAAHDVAAAVRWLRAHAATFRLLPARLALLGFSAGGNLALEAALAVHARVAAVAAWSAPTDLATFLRESRDAYASRSIRAYVGCAPAACPARWRAASPALQVRRGDPPLFLAGSTHELVPLAQLRELDERARARGVGVSLLVLPGTLHAAAYASAAWRPTQAFLRRVLG
jgi:acetyl esterase